MKKLFILLFLISSKIYAQDIFPANTILTYQKTIKATEYNSGKIFKINSQNIFRIKLYGRNDEYLQFTYIKNIKRYNFRIYAYYSLIKNIC